MLGHYSPEQTFPHQRLSGRGFFADLRDHYPDPHARGRAFERLMQYAFRRHPDLYGFDRFVNVWRWMEWPDREAHGYGADVGIDLVAEQTEAWGRGLCAIQTKFYDSGKIAKAGVNSFLAASGTALFKDRILVVTSSLTDNAKMMIKKASPRCQVLYRSDLESWPVDWAEFFDCPESLAFQPDRYGPFPYQNEAVRKVVADFEKHDRGKLILPCGTGKSVVALWIAEKTAGRGGRVLYLVPSIALMGQTMREWARQRHPNIPHRYIGICSDTRTGRNDEDADMAELAIPVTTDPERIVEQLSLEASNRMTVVFCTYQSLGLVAQAQEEGAPDFDLTLCDEAHRTTGIQESTKKGTPFTLIHDEYQVGSDKRLYMTATPRLYTRRMRAKAAQHHRDFDIYSMDDEETYGPEFYRMGFGDAVEAGHLTDYQVLVIAVAENPVLEQFNSIEVGEGLRPITVEEAVKFAGCWDALADPTTRTTVGRVTGLTNSEQFAKRAIAFTNTIRSSMGVERYWGPVIDMMSSSGATAAPTGESGLLSCAIKHVDGSKNALERANTIAWLQAGDSEGGCRIVTNAKCLTEGVDVPALDAVLFLEPKRSQIDVIQAVGRVMRRSKGKEYGYVVLPVVVPTGMSLTDDKVLSGSDFKQVWNVLKALRSHDERLDVTINTADLSGRLPFKIIPVGVCDSCGHQGCDGGDECKARLSVHETVQGRLPFENTIASKLVEVCGDRQYWKRWGKEVAKVTERIMARIHTVLRLERELRCAFDRFSDAMRGTIGGHIGQEALTTMLAQHIVTIPVFDALFSESGFADRNPISKALNELLDEFKSHGIYLRDEAQDLDRFYTSVENRLQGASDSDARLRVMLEVYETFFKEAMPDDVKRLGIVYTPLELVDFILRSADAVLRQEFDRSLSDENVHVLDPFTGTGTFINRLLTQKNNAGAYLVRDEDVTRKFCGNMAANVHTPLLPEVHANEIVLLAYYLAAIKIEEGYRERTGGYEPFPGIVLTDTFLMKDSDRLPNFGPMGRNTTRAKRQNELPIQVIISNPPWSGGQKSSGDDNPNIDYPALEQRVRDTYGKRHKETTGRGAGKSSGNLYVQSIRWASDRLNGPNNDPTLPGVIGFVHPNSLSNGTSLAGMRAALRDEFTDIYVVNLRGDAMKSGDEYRAEGDKLFGQGSRNGVQITVLVRNPHKNPTAPAELHYAEVPEYSKLDAKFEWLAQIQDVTSDQFKTVPLNKSHHWINLTDGTFQNLLPVCEIGKNARDGHTAIDVHVSGVITSFDTYVYSFSYNDLISKVMALIDAYEDARDQVNNGITIERITQNDDLQVIQWTGKLKQSLKRNKKIVFDESRIREVLYRPFTKLWLYEDDRILSSVKTASALFPKDTITGESRRVKESQGESRRVKESQGESSGLSPEHPGRFRISRHQLHQRFQRRRKHAHTNHHPMETILMTGPSNMAIFGTVATRKLPDFHVMGPGQQTRSVPRRRS